MANENDDDVHITKCNDDDDSVKILMSRGNFRGELSTSTVPVRPNLSVCDHDYVAAD